MGGREGGVSQLIYKPNYLFIIMSVLLLGLCTMLPNRLNQIKFMTAIFVISLKIWMGDLIGFDDYAVDAVQHYE